MRTPDSLLSAAVTLTMVAGMAGAELVVYENTNPGLGPLALYDPNNGSPIFGQSLDITRGAFAQPKAGETPRGSIFFMHTSGFAGEFIWMGTGMLTLTARSTQGTPILDPYANYPVDYFGPQAFAQGDTVDASANFIEGWRAIHGYNNLTGLPGVFTTADTFTVGVGFELSDGTHFGFAQFKRDYEIRNGRVSIQLTPQRWGYETVAGVGAGVVPAPGASSLLTLLGLGAAIRRRRR